MRRKRMAVVFILCLPAMAYAQSPEWTTSGANISNTNAGNVGIGTATPANALHVVVENGTVNVPFKVETTGVDSISGLSLKNDARNWNLRVDGTDADKFKIFDANAGLYRLTITTAGDVGIGTVAPTSLLHVKNDTDANIAAAVENLGTGLASAAVLGAKSDTAAVNFQAHGSARTLSRFGVALGGWAEFLQWQGNGLAIGTLGSAPVILGTNGQNRLHIAADGKVGMGTASPASELHIVRANNGPTITMESTGTPARTWQMVVRDNDGHFAINDIGRPGAEFILDNAGNLIISGNQTVAGNLVVTGDITGARVLNAVYQDVAEWVTSDQALTPGNVVIVAAGKIDQVVASSQAYDTRVAGVISDQPGVLLGVPGKSKVKVATTGRVRVRVDATANPVEAGDILVTSDKPGTAMKSVPVDVAGIKLHRPGTVVGKALESLPGGEGEILVLLSLQ